MIDPTGPTDAIDAVDPAAAHQRALPLGHSSEETLPVASVAEEPAQENAAQLELFSVEEPAGDNSEGASGSYARANVGDAATNVSELAAPYEQGDGVAWSSPEQRTYQPSWHVVRTPNALDAFLFGVLLALGLLITTGLMGAALHFHWFGLKNLAQAETDTRLALGTQLLIYGIALTGAAPLFRSIWGKGFLSGLHWNLRTALRKRNRLFGIAFLCNVFAMIGNFVLPFPPHAPIDKMFTTASDAWLLFLFGITVAPFFEEMMFRGFLLPAMATAWDWMLEKMRDRQAPEPDAEGNPVWSRGAMIFAALAVSAPFALMHSAQVGDAWGPISLLYCVSLILCAVRLRMRSLAASTMVHSAYNFMLFSVMLWETGGFRHMDKL